MLSASLVANVIKDDPYYLGLFSHCESACIAVVSRNGYTIRHLTDPSEAVCFAAIAQTADSIFYIKKPTEEMQLASIRGHGGIQWIKNPSEAVCLIAVQRNRNSLYHIHKPTEVVCLAAVRAHGWSIRYIPRPTAEMFKIAAASHSVRKNINPNFRHNDILRSLMND